MQRLDTDLRDAQHRHFIIFTQNDTCTHTLNLGTGHIPVLVDTCSRTTLHVRMLHVECRM